MTFVHADPAATALDLVAAVGATGSVTAPAGHDDDWLAGWLAADAAASAAMDEWLRDLDEPFEAAPIPALAAALPDGAVLWAGSSMPIRDLDAWLPSTDRAIRVMANRGANGIDGVLSSALGSAAVAGGPVALIVGDLSFLHDLGGLVTARLAAASLLVVLVDNDGGGIFSFLPQAATDAPDIGLPGSFEALFGTPHGIDPGPLVGALGGTVVRADGASLRPAIESAVGRLASGRAGLTVVHLRAERARNVELHQALAGRIAEALAGLPGPAA